MVYNYLDHTLLLNRLRVLPYIILQHIEDSFMSFLGLVTVIQNHLE